eukprot:366575-Chlamydomonas_euryale.AAC.12
MRQHCTVPRTTSAGVNATERGSARGELAGGSTAATAAAPTRVSEGLRTAHRSALGGTAATPVAPTRVSWGLRTARRSARGGTAATPPVSRRPGSPLAQTCKCPHRCRHQTPSRRRCGQGKWVWVLTPTLSPLRSVNCSPRGLGYPTIGMAPLTPGIRAHHLHWHAQSVRQRDNVHVVRLLAHGLNVLLAKHVDAWGVIIPERERERAVQQRASGMSQQRVSAAWAAASVSQQQAKAAWAAAQVGSKRRQHRQQREPAASKTSLIQQCEPAASEGSVGSSASWQQAKAA